MIKALEIKKKYTCDVCHLYVTTTAEPKGWINIDGFEPDDRRPSPNIDLCPSCAVRAVQQIYKDDVLNQLVESMKDEFLVYPDSVEEHLKKLYPNEEIVAYDS